MKVDVPGIPLRRTDGTVDYARVDPEDFAWLNEYRWGGQGRGYVARYDGTGRKRIYMHRQIMGLEESDPRMVDHINGNTLDNRRCNLRLVTHAENCANHPGLGGTSKHRGVSWDKRRGAWRVQFNLGGRRSFLGYFDNEDAAAEVARAFLAERGLSREVVPA